MDEQNIKSWLKKAKANSEAVEGQNAPSSSLVVVGRNSKTNAKDNNQNSEYIKKVSRGAMIMEIAEKLRPVFSNFFNGRRDDNGMLFQPSHIRGFALNCAEYLVKAQEKDNNAAA